jgi:hypothetical protein
MKGIYKVAADRKWLAQRAAGVCARTIKSRFWRKNGAGSLPASRLDFDFTGRYIGTKYAFSGGSPTDLAATARDLCGDRTA